MAGISILLRLVRVVLGLAIRVGMPTMESVILDLLVLEVLPLAGIPTPLQRGVKMYVFGCSLSLDLQRRDCLLTRFMTCNSNDHL